jgi:cytochrome c
MNSLRVLVVTALALTVLIKPAAAQTGDAARGERVFRACAPCHSLEAGRNMTGPSLADLWNRKAGTLSSFSRYSPALKSSGLTWDDKTLDAWLADPQHLIPGNTMTFPGVKDNRLRVDLLAFLKEATQPGATPFTTAQWGNRMGDGMMGMMGGGSLPT